MFTTLVSQEFRSLGRSCAVIIGLDLLTGFILTGVGMLPVPFLSTFCARFALFVFLALPLAVLLLLGVNYWRTMYGRRGYLTLALPVRGRVIFWAKLTHAAIWSLVSSTLMLAALFMSAWLLRIAEGGGLGDIVDELRHYYDAVGAGLVWGGLAVLIIQLLCTLIELASLMSVGARSRWSSLGFGAPVIGYVILQVVGQVLSLLLMVTVPVGLREGDGRIVLGEVTTPLLNALRDGTEVTTIGLGSLLAGPILATVLAIWAVNSIEHHTSLR